MKFASTVTLGLIVVVGGARAALQKDFEFELGRSGYCLAAEALDNGTPVTIIPCVRNTPLEVSWTFTPGGAVTTITIRNGEQTIKKCLDVKNGANANGTKLQLWDCTPGNKNQMFKVNGDNTIAWANTNKCVDNSNGNVTNANPAQVWTCSKGNGNQQWVQHPANGSVFNNAAVRIQMPTSNPKGNGCMTAVENADGAEVIFTQCTFNEPGDSGPSEVWTLTSGTTPPGVDCPIGPFGLLQIFGDKCLDVPNGSIANGVKLQIFTCFPGNGNQFWHVDCDQGIRWQSKNKCLDLTNGNKTNGNRLQTWDCGFTTTNPNQMWIVNPV